MNTHNPLSRRSFLKIAGAITGMATLAACTPAPIAPTGDSPASGAAAEPITIRYGRHDPRRRCHRHP